MEFEYFSFDVEPFLRTQTQPFFVLKRLNPSFRYWTLTDLDQKILTPSLAPSQGVRIPVFAVSVPANTSSSSVLTEAPTNSLQGLSHGSLLFTLGFENALKAASSLSVTLKELSGGRLWPEAEKVIVVLSTECHAVDNKYRAYFGVSFGVSK